MGKLPIFQQHDCFWIWIIFAKLGFYAIPNISIFNYFCDI